MLAIHHHPVGNGERHFEQKAADLSKFALADSGWHGVVGCTEGASPSFCFIFILF